MREQWHNTRHSVAQVLDGVLNWLDFRDAAFSIAWWRVLLQLWVNVHYLVVDDGSHDLKTLDVQLILSPSLFLLEVGELAERVL